jgi:hypothetical protein
LESPIDGYYGDWYKHLFSTAVGYRTVTGIYISAVGIDDITTTQVGVSLRISFMHRAFISFFFFFFFPMHDFTF